MTNDISTTPIPGQLWQISSIHYGWRTDKDDGDDTNRQFKRGEVVLVTQMVTPPHRRDDDYDVVTRIQVLTNDGTIWWLFCEL